MYVSAKRQQANFYFDFAGGFNYSSFDSYYHFKFFATYLLRYQSYRFAVRMQKTEERDFIN